MPNVARPLADFQPRERLAGVPHTTRRFACRSALALGPDGATLAIASDQGAGTYEAWTLSATGGTPQRAIGIEDHAARRRRVARPGRLARRWSRARDHRHRCRAPLARRAGSEDGRARDGRSAAVGHRARGLISRRSGAGVVGERGRVLEAALARR